ncbi:MAG: DUF262 domain-containing protein [bacterium]|nr:DUF262 domain-containing protein [bacterium]
MKISPKQITVEELVEGYADSGDDGVVGYGGRLDIRPAFQREFVYKEKQRAAVIESVNQGFPLNAMYWADRGDGTYEVIDGQQRTISIAQYVVGTDGDGIGDFSVGSLYFHNLPADQADCILGYKLMVYVCSGTDSEKLDWFRVINIAGAKLSDQELRNAVYSGPWVSDAKRYFSRPGCPAAGVGEHHVNGILNRQEFLETAIKWASGGNIEDYMALRQKDSSANELWDHFRAVIDWAKSVFPESRPNLTKKVDWGPLYDEFGSADLDPEALEAEVARLVADDEVQKQQGIYPYVLTHEEKHLNLRAFSKNQKQRAYEKQGGKCAECGNSFDIGQMEADHIKPWSEGGKTVDKNCQMLCREHNRRKGAK